MTESEYRDWARQYDSAKSSIVNKDEKIGLAVAKIENNFLLVGATAIEDEL